MKLAAQNRYVPALKVNQWLPEWDKVPFSPEFHRKRPKPYFYLFTLPAPWLKSLSGIYRRTARPGQSRSTDLGIQRRHDERRSDEIHDFVQYGFPWSELSPSKRLIADFNDLRKPGWLPTAIVVNILQVGDLRRNVAMLAKDAITVSESGASSVNICLPHKFTGPNWNPERLHPLEIIDGQHRLWAFEKDNLGTFELPVVAFHGLDISWQAYLFWTINIRPKRINASLAFDLYPLLRTEDWLDKIEGHPIYRETRAQELTEALWAIPESPWYQRINMLGESGLGQAMVTQAAWIRSLLATFVKAWENPRIQIGGLFGASLGQNEEVLPWSRAQQAAFLIYMGQCVRDAIRRSQDTWAKSLRTAERQVSLFESDDLAFYGPNSLLTTDQGIRGLLHVVNDLCYVQAEQLRLFEWTNGGGAEASDEEAVRKSITSLKRQRVAGFLKQLAGSLSKYDWRTSSTPNLSERDRVQKAALRGSGGYKELRRDLLRRIAQESKAIGQAARQVISALGYD
jgi:hypothetical protein